ncbi:hypothetical protein ABZ883_28905 [Streptomyces sp. NPDC046977]|uniref:hypothetical protein n=1 Tax=Streptomyces sp. NPDC046977 TaxID=3154703 RepID=UPI0033E90380
MRAGSARVLFPAALLLTVACTAGEPETGCELRDTTRQITDRFSALGTVVRTQWCAIDLTGGSDRVPGPSDIRLVGYFDTTAADMQALLDHPGWTFRRSQPQDLPGPVARAAGTASVPSWTTSTDLETSITRDLYSAAF